MTKQIELTQGKFSLIDDEDFERVMLHKWSAYLRGDKINWNAVSYIHGEYVNLSRFVTNAPSGVLVDHKNSNTLDNRKENLRFASKQENGRNRKVSSTNKTGYKGVCWDRNRFKAAIGVNGKRIQLGRYKSAIEAAKAYDEAAKNMLGNSQD